MKLYIIRHGETAWNRIRRLQGHQGPDLNEQGVKLAEITSDALKDVPFDICFSSPVIRTMHTARIILRDRDVPIVEEPRLIEIGFGIWEGKSVTKENREVPVPQFLDMKTDPFDYVPPEGGESVGDVVERMAAFYEELTAREDLASSTVLISTHGCASRAFLYAAAGRQGDFWHGIVPANCAVSILEVKDGRAEVLAFDNIYYPEEYLEWYYAMRGYKKPI